MNSSGFSNFRPEAPVKVEEGHCSMAPSQSRSSRRKGRGKHKRNNQNQQLMKQFSSSSLWEIDFRIYQRINILLYIKIHFLLLMFTIYCCRSFLEDFQNLSKMFFASWILIGTLGLRPTCPLPLYLSFKFIGLFRRTASLLRSTISLSLASFICSRYILANPKVCILTFSNTGHSHRMCTDVSFSAPHLLHKGVLVLLILYSMYILQIDIPV